MHDGGGSRVLRLVVVDDHPAAREGLRLRLGREPDLLIVGEASSATEAAREVPRLRPDVVLIDMSLRDGDGIDLLARLCWLQPTLRGVILTFEDAPHHRRRALERGASAFVGKQESTEVLLGAIRGRGSVRA